MRGTPYYGNTEGTFADRMLTEVTWETGVILRPAGSQGSPSKDS
jgi:hypothetical protein